MKTWYVEELRAFLSFVCTDRNVALYRTALMTGMRRGELLGLRHRDLDLPNARLHVRQQWTKDGAHGRVFKGLKNDSVAWRTIGLDEETVLELRTHVERQRAERARLEGGDRDHDLVFCHPDGTPYDPDWTTTLFERLAAAAPGVLPIRFHDMRHTHATLLLESGESVVYVAERLGDTVETVVETYAHVTPKMRATAPTRLAALVRAGTNVDGAEPLRPSARSDELMAVAERVGCFATLQPTHVRGIPVTLRGVSQARRARAWSGSANELLRE